MRRWWSRPVFLFHQQGYPWRGQHIQQFLKIHSLSMPKLPTLRSHRAGLTMPRTAVHAGGNVPDPSPKLDIELRTGDKGIGLEPIPISRLPGRASNSTHFSYWTTVGSHSSYKGWRRLGTKGGRLMHCCTVEPQKSYDDATFSESQFRALIAS